LSYPRESATARSIHTSLAPATAGVLEGDGVCDEVTERVDDRLGEGVGSVDGRGVTGTMDEGGSEDTFQRTSKAPGLDAAELPPNEYKHTLLET
jgi:hypothetical protein